MIKCGILFNAKQRGFEKYLEWIVKSQERNNFLISFVHTNGDMDIPNIKLGTLRSVIDESDIVFSLGYWKKITKEDIHKVKMGIVNFHHSYRLKFQGRHCASWALIHNEKIHGSTLHFIDEKIDEGKIIDTDFFEINEEEVSEDLFMRSSELGFNLLKKNFFKLINNKDIVFEHDQPKERFSYKAKDLKHELLFEEAPSSFLRKVRALTFDKAPAPYLLLNGKKIFLKLEGYDDGQLKKQ